MTQMLREAELAKKRAEKTMEIKKAQEKLARETRALDNALKTNHLVETQSWDVKSAAEELKRKKQELDRLR